MGEVPVPEIGPNDLLVRIRQTAICGTDVHIYNWDDWAQKDHPRAHGRGPRVQRRRRRRGKPRAGLCRRRPRERRRTHHLRPLPQLPRRQASPLPKHRRRGRQPPGGLRRLPGDPGHQRLQAPGRHLRRNRRLPRPPRQRGAYGAELRSGGRGRADHRRRAHRHHGQRHRASRGRAARGRDGRERLPARARPKDGREPGRQRASREASRTRWGTSA